MKYLTVMVFSLLPFLLVGQIEEIKEIEVESVDEMVKDGAIFIDVREKSELEKLAYCIPDALHIALSDIDSIYTTLPKDKTLILACRSGGRSMKAAKFLSQNGYSKLVNLKGGIQEWQGKGYPVIVEGVLPKSCKSGSKSCCSKGKTACSSAHKTSCCSDKKK